MPFSEPLAYFLTWTTYGTWLPGDNRGWAQRPGQLRMPDPAREARARERMVEDEFRLTDETRSRVETAIRRHAEYRSWGLHALAVRSNHVHCVVTALMHTPEQVMTQFKAWSTRSLQAFYPERRHFWTKRGSTRKLFTEESLLAAIRYVNECQGDP